MEVAINLDIVAFVIESSNVRGHDIEIVFWQIDCFPPSISHIEGDFGECRIVFDGGFVYVMTSAWMRATVTTMPAYLASSY